ncbi:MAG: UDP-3-O-(3-hydroxymyristoyl)glucosamine N-acyltransferase, partial [Lentisphaerae bacterium]|nr:UDP-3-O-(3-hydroxymyristoyl)glucosamine N-acyltransferase [Lentisphaerota bacterium]
MNFTIAEIAEKISGTVEGDASVKITGPADIRNALPGQISFVANPRYASSAENTKASAVIVPSNWDRPCPATLIRVENADKAFAFAANLFALPSIAFEPGIHPSAVISDSANLGKDVFIGANVVIEPGAVIGDNSVVYPGCYIGHSVL